MGVGNVHRFPFLEPPKKSFIAKALQRLVWLGALKESDGSITKIGEKMAELPLEPLYSLLLLKSEELKCSEEILTIISMLSVENVFFSPR